MSRTALVRLGALGDLVLLGAVTGQLEGEVTVVTRPPLHEVARELIGVDRVLTWPAGTEASEVVREGAADRWIDLQGGLRTAGLALALRGHLSRVHRHGLRRRARLLGLPLGPRPDVPTLYARACGVAPAPPPWIAGWEPDGTLVLAPGAAWPPKRWTPEGFAAVGRAWEGPVVVLGGPGEGPLCRAVAQAVPGAHWFAEEGFRRTLSTLRAASAIVAGDTGLLHLGGALGMPVVGLFGPTDPEDGFFVYRGEVVSRTLSCRPCALHRVEACHRGHHACMDLDPSAVIAALQRVTRR